ncbi:MAG: RHS repeat-associated core domain-containing protein, partial [Clostridia bacterium]|nr:RHS repeat-associated core domain-containing protein [Clostridia bacterium]
LDGAGYYMAGTELEWQGRQLMEYRGFLDEGDGNGRYYDMSTTLTFTYNADGIRTSKTVDGIKHEYLLNGSQILGERWTSGGVKYTLIYLYDENGSPMGLKYRTNSYAANEYDYFFFEKNLQGDIIAVYDESGTKIGSYIYDAWGVCTTSVISGNTTLENSIVRDYNPFRYRGYYYDTQTGLYYLQSRYYNPTWGRFISADGYVSTGTGLLGYNMFAYCNNNPVMLVDPTGDFPWLFVVIGAGLLCMTSCESSSAPVSSTVYENKYSEDRGYIKSATEAEAAIAGFENLYNTAKDAGFDREYGFIIYQYNEGNKYGESSDYYWTSVVTPGSTSDWNPNNVTIPWDCVTIISIAHIHVDNDSREANGGFSGKDIKSILADSQKGVCSNFYVMVLGRTIPNSTANYHVFKYDFSFGKGVKFYSGN